MPVPPPPPPLPFTPPHPPSLWPQQNQAAPTQRPAEGSKNQLRNQMWTGVLGVALVEGQDLPQYGQGDIYVRFRLGEQKYKSKVGRWFVILNFSFPFPPLLPPTPHAVS